MLGASALSVVFGLGLVATDLHAGEIHNAALGRHLPKIKAQLAAGTAVGAVDRQGNTALHWACRGKNGKYAATLLLDRGAPASAANSAGATPLHWAAMFDAEPDVAALLLKRGAAVNARDSDGDTALHWATDLDVVELLVRHGADVRAANESNSTPLHSQVLLGNHTAAIRLLLGKGANPGARDAAGQTPIDLARELELDDVVAALEAADPTPSPAE